ncbi:hypothetical protein [Rhizobium sp. LEGMi135b]
MNGATSMTGIQSAILIRFFPAISSAQLPNHQCLSSPVLWNHEDSCARAPICAEKLARRIMILLLPILGALALLGSVLLVMFT